MGGEMVGGITNVSFLLVFRTARYFHTGGSVPEVQVLPPTAPPSTLLACRTGCHLSPREQAVFQHQLRCSLGAGHARVDEEALRADPIPGQVEVGDPQHSGIRTSGEAAVLGSGERADGLDAQQVLAPDQHVAPTRLRRVEQVLEVALVLTWVTGVPWIQLLERDNKGPSLGRDARRVN